MSCLADRDKTFLRINLGNESQRRLNVIVRDVLVTDVQ